MSGIQGPTAGRRRSSRRRPGWVVWLLSAAAAVLALCVGGLGGALLGAVRVGEGQGPEYPPPLPAAFPDASLRYLPGVTVESLEAWMGRNEYECRVESDAGSLSGAEHELVCRAPSGHGVSASVRVEYDEPDRVRAASVRCVRGPLTHEDYCWQLFGFFAVNAFEAQPGLQNEAQQWAEDNAENDAVIMLGGILLRADIESSQIRLQPEP